MAIDLGDKDQFLEMCHAMVRACDSLPEDLPGQGTWWVKTLHFSISVCGNCSEGRSQLLCESKPCYLDGTLK